MGPGQRYADSMNSTSNAEPRAAQTPRLGRGTVARYAAGSLGTGGFATLPGLVLVYYLTDSLGVTALAAGAIVTLAKVWDVLIDPIIGGLSDRALAVSGSRRGPMLVGAIGLPVAFVLTFAVPAGLDPGASATWVLIAFIAAATLFSLFQVPYIALPAELTDGYRERTRLLSWRVVVLTLAILLFGAGGPELRGLFPDDPRLGYLVMAIGAALLLGLGLYIATTVAPRPADTVAGNAEGRSSAGTTGRGAFTTGPGSGSAPRPGSAIAGVLTHYHQGIAVLRESRPFRTLLLTFVLQGLTTGLMLAGAQFVATWVLRDEGAVTILFVALIAPAILFAPLWRITADKLGKERSFRIASLIFLVATIALTAMVWSPGWWIVGPVALAGAAYAGMQTLPMAMLPDVIAHDAARRGHGRTKPTAVASGEDPDSRAGVFGGVWTAGETAGMALGSTVLALALAATGYVESVAGQTVEQPGAAVAAISLCFSLIPAALMLASLFVLERYELRERDLGRAPGPDEGDDVQGAGDPGGGSTGGSNASGGGTSGSGSGTATNEGGEQ